MNLPVEVIEAVREQRAVLFVGSRFAAEAAEAVGRAYPDDAALAKQLGWKRPRQLMGTRKKGPVQPSPAAGAQSLEASQGRGALEARVRLLRDLADAAPTTAHDTAVRRFPLIFTTCQDDALTRAATAADTGHTLRQRHDPVPGLDPDTPVIYHWTGSFALPPSLVLTPADRGRPLAREIEKATRSLLRRKVVFFVGYKPDEEEFELLWDDLTRCYGGELPRCHLAVAQGRIDDYLWQKWVWRGLLMFTADPIECMQELERHLGA